jgi:glycerol-3-phosphate dehydrogenase
LGDLDTARCITAELNIHGYHQKSERFGPLAVYGSDAPRVQEIGKDEPALAERVHDRLDLTGAEVVWACREEMAHTVDDVLSRRSRALVFDARAAIEAAPAVAALMARELGRDEKWIADQLDAFNEIANGYLPV